MRTAELERITKETSIRGCLNLDGSGEAKVSTGIGFLDHMLTLMAKHGFMDLTLEATGDLEVDAHHTVEDVAIVLGDLLKEALGGKEGIKRYGSVILPMDETLMICAVDLSSRPYLNMDVTFTVERLGQMDTELFFDFFYSLMARCGMNLHFKQLTGRNNHHIAEAMFKALGQALDQAKTVDPRIQGVRSSKGKL